MSLQHICPILYDNYSLGLYRDAEKQFVSALKQQQLIDTILMLGKVLYLAEASYFSNYILHFCYAFLVRPAYLLD